jgi:Na+/melibiose symporter-like transporter
MFSVVLSTTSYLFISAAKNGLISTIGQQHVMSGQISAAGNVFASLVAVVALLIGGPLSDLLEQSNGDQAMRILFLIGAAIMAAVAGYAAWKPHTVFDNVHSEPVAAKYPIDDLKRLMAHWPIYTAMLVWLLWNFAPGSDTPLQYYLQNALGAKDTDWGRWNAIFAASFIPTFIGYGFLCQKFPLKTLLLWGTVIAIPQMMPLLLITSVQGAFLAAGGQRPDGRRRYRRLF